MIIGMITVFVILSLVVLLGKFLIAFVNKWFPLQEFKSVSGPAFSGIGPKKVAAILAAVEVITKGRGNVTSVKKLED